MSFVLTKSLLILMPLFFLFVIIVCCFSVLPLTYKILSCNAGTVPFCEMDPLVQIGDSSADVGKITYSNILSFTFKNTNQTIKFPYFENDGSSSLSYIYISFTFASSVDTDNLLIKTSPTGTNIFNVDLSPDGSVSTPITVQALNTVSAEQLADLVIFILTNKNITQYLHLDYFQNSKTQIIYALVYEGTGTPTITVSGTNLTSAESILGFTTLNLNKDNFQTHDPIVENANDGFLDIKAQQKAIAKYPNSNIAACSDPSAVSANKANTYFLNPSHGLYYKGSDTIPSTPTPCVYNCGPTTTPCPSVCGYRFVDRTDNPNNTTDYQVNHIYYASTGTTNPSADSSTYYDGYGSNPTALTSKYTGVSNNDDVLGFPQLQENLMCGGFLTSSQTTPWKLNNFDNASVEPTSNPNNSDGAYNYSTHPRLLYETGSVISEPIKLGFG